MCSNKNYSFDEFLRQKPTVDELVGCIDFENKWISFGLILAVRKQDLTEDIEALIPDKTIALLELWLNTSDSSRRQLLEDLRKYPNTKDVADNYEKSLMEIYEGQCALEESTTQYSSEFVGGQIQVSSIDEPSPEQSEKVHDQDEIEIEIDVMHEKLSSLLDSLQVLKKKHKEEKEESRRKIESICTTKNSHIIELKHLVAQKDEKLKQQSAELQTQKRINKVLILENEKFKSNIKEKEDRIAVIESELAQRLQDLKQLKHELEINQIGSAPEQIKTNIKVQHITDSPSKQYVEGKDEICLKGLTLDNLESLVPLLLKTKAVTCLNIHSSPFEESFTHHFSVLITDNLTLKCLLLTHNTIDDEGIKILAHTLKNNPTLTFLSLDFNSEVTSESCLSLADLLRANRTLRVLSLSHTNIDVDGACVLVRSLESNDTLKQLVLDERHRLSFSDASDRLQF